MPDKTMPDKPPRILLINRVYPPARGATGRLLRDLARALALDGWEVTVLATGSARVVEMDGAIKVHRCRAPLQPRSVRAYGWTAAKLFIAGLLLPRPAVIVTLTDPPLLAIPGGWLARLKGARHIHWCQDLYPDLLPVLGVRMPPPLYKILQRRMRRTLRRAAHVVAIGACMARRLERGGVAPQRLSVIPNWPDAELVFGQEERRSRPRDYQLLDAVDAARPMEELRRDDDPKFRILYAGTLGLLHPLETVLDAAAFLVVSHPEIQFIFAGDGAAFDRLGRARATRGLENIRLLPFQPASRLRELMESGDIHLASFDMRAAGLAVPSKIYSAFATGRPVIFIGPAASEVAQTIETHSAGAVLPQGEAQRLVEQILAYREQPDKWFAAHEGALRAGEASAPGHAIAAWLAVVRNVVQKKVRVRRGG